MQGWYYKLFGMDFGPVPFEKLIELAKDRQFSREDVVRFGDTGKWRRVGSMGLLMAHLPFESAEIVIGAAAPPADQGAMLGGDTIVSSAQPSPPAETAETQDADRRWWCKIQGREYGPVELPKLIEWAAAGRLLQNDEVRFGQDPYVPAGELPGLFPTPPAAPIQKAS